MAGPGERSDSGRRGRCRASGACAGQDGRRRRPPTGPGSASPGRPESPGTSSTVTSTSSPASRCSCSATTAAFSRRCAAELDVLEVAASAAARSAERARRVDPVGRRLEHLDSVGAQEPVTFVALGHFSDNPLPRQRVPDEDHDALVPGDDESAVSGLAAGGLEAVADQGRVHTRTLAPSREVASVREGVTARPWLAAPPHGTRPWTENPGDVAVDMQSRCGVAEARRCARCSRWNVRSGAQNGTPRLLLRSRSSPSVSAGPRVVFFSSSGRGRGGRRRHGPG